MGNTTLSRHRPHPRPTVNPRALVGRVHIAAIARRSQVLVDIVMVVVVFACAFAINNSYVKSTELHPDETRWLNRAYYLEDFTDPYGPTWQDYYISQGQPPGGSYLMGLGLLVQGESLHPNGVWDFHFGSEWNRGRRSRTHR